MLIWPLLWEKTALSPLRKLSETINQFLMVQSNMRMPIGGSTLCLLASILEYICTLICLHEMT